MRKVTAGLFISLDGVVEDPHLWQGDVFDDIMNAAMDEMMADQDTLLMGRVTYEAWAGYWPTSTDEPYATYINNVPKYVISTTLESVDWRNTTLAEGSLADTVARLKEQPGRTIGVSGSPTLVRSLLHQGLLDELILMIHPVIAGSGKRLFEEGDARQQLKVVDSKTTSSGVLIVTYQPRRDAA